MVELCTLASGSSGNCLAVGAAGRWVLVDAGISARRICAGLSELGAGPEDLAGILITHEHTDHIAGLAVLCRRTAAPLYASPGTAAALAEKLPQLAGRIVPVAPGAPFEAGGLEVESFPTSHDSAQSVGYALTDGLRRAVIATDLGYITPAVGAAAAGADLLVAECNHEEDWVRTGPYPPFLKSRILGDRGPGLSGGPAGGAGGGAGPPVPGEQHPPAGLGHGVRRPHGGGSGGWPGRGPGGGPRRPAGQQMGGIAP